MLIVRNVDDDGNLIEDSRVEHVFPECRAVVGSVANADLQIDGLAELSFVIDRDSRNNLVLDRKDPHLDLKINRRKSVESRQRIRNGDVLEFGSCHVLITIQFERAEQHRRTSLVPLVTIVLVILIILAEVCVVTWLPNRIYKSRIAGSEILRQETNHQMDTIRWKMRPYLIQDRGDETFKQLLKLYKLETDRMALYLRNQQTSMSLEQYERFKQRLDTIDKQINLLVANKLVPPKRVLNTKAAVERILQEKEAKE